MMREEKKLHNKHSKNLIIITPNFQQSSTGGLYWLNNLAKYAKECYRKTVIIDVMSLPTFIKKSRVLNFFYYFAILLLKRNTLFFADHNLHFRLAIPLLLSFRICGNYYGVITHHILFTLRPNPVLQKLEFFSERLLLSHAAFIIVPSVKTRKDIIEILGVHNGKIYIIHPTGVCINTEYFKRKLHNKILFVGNLEPRKGIEVLIRALSHLDAVDFSVDIIGGCQRERYFETLKYLVNQLGLAKNITFHGRVDEADISRYYRNANIFVFPSLHEGYGMVLLEAMSFGLPVVASNIPPINEIIKDEINGLLFSVGDSSALAKVLKRLLSDKKLQVEIGKRNFQESLRFPNWDTVIDETFRVIKQYLFIK